MTRRRRQAVSATGPKRAWLVPEVVQTSSMDCGPAALTALCAGFRIPANYDWLRELCQTDVDGTAITTLEELAITLGLDAQQVMLPPDHLLLPDFPVLPAICVVVLANGFTHFVLAWRSHGPLVQVMDPARGRVWLPKSRLLADVYRHRLPIAADEWRAWAGSDSFCQPLELRLRALRLPRPQRVRLLREAQADPGWFGLASLDAATRLVTRLVEARSVRPGQEAETLIARLTAEERTATAGKKNGAWQPRLIPTSAWTVMPDPESENGLIFEAGLVVSIAGMAPAEGAAPLSSSTALANSLRQAPSLRPEQRLWRLLGAERTVLPAFILAAVAVGAGVTLEIFLLRQLLDTAATDGAAVTLAGLAGLMAGLLCLELGIARIGHFLGRRLETRLRQAFYEKMPRLGDHYFRSRLVSDLAQRAFELRRLRLLPLLAGNALRTGATLLFTAAGLVVLYPAGAPMALLAVGVTLGAAVLSQPLLLQHEMRQRTYAGALTRFTYDSLLGLLPLRSHGAEPALRAEQEELVVEWARSGRRALATRLWIIGIQLIVTMLIAIALVRGYIVDGGEASGVIVLLYLALRLPELGQALSVLARQYPLFRSTVLRLLEPLSAPVESAQWYGEEASTPAQSAAVAAPAGAALALDGVTVHAAGQTILQDISLAVAPGEHVAIVGRSGAGKSSLVGLLLGWHRPAAGTVAVDGRLLQGETLQAVRRATAWVDPQVQVWNAPLDVNIAYGNGEIDPRVRKRAARTAALDPVIEKLGDCETSLGEGGRRVSGGEGQRVRLARALARPDVRLAILDEPFRGLDRGQRHALLQRARDHWRDATLLFISHDVADTLCFDRVLVVEDGRIIEDGTPATLRNSETRYAALLSAEQSVRARLWDNPTWRRLGMVDGRLE